MMTALAAFFAMVPMALALGRGSEANAPLGRAILGGLLAGEPATLFVLPALYALLVRDEPLKDDAPLPADDPRAVARRPDRAGIPRAGPHREPKGPPGATDP